MKLYIPTCTLNFNNIFATESISPISFYSKRGFGNKRFNSVPANNYEDCIVLFSKYPKFEIENSDLENYPMVIEIDTGDYNPGKFSKVLECNGVNTYACTDTIFINPFHSFIYFNSYEDRQSVLTKAQQSLENKFYELYKANLKIKTNERKSWFANAVSYITKSEREEFTWSPQYNDFSLKVDNSDVRTDVVIDRIKGFIYCYLIGSNMSISPETAKLKSIARDLKNIFSAVINSPEKKPNTTQDAALLHGINEFNKIYSLKDIDTINNRVILQKKLMTNPLELSYEDCIKFLDSLNLFEVFCSNLQLSKVYDARELWTCLESSNTEQFVKAMENLEAAVNKIEKSDLSTSSYNQINELIEVDSSSNVIIKDRSYNSSFYQRLIRAHIQGDYKKIMEENGVGESLAQAYNGGKILRSLMGKKWSNSAVSTYINNLLQYFQENSSFDINSINNEVMSSFAAFCQKGDNIDRLADYLIQCGFANYRLALGLYGATRGFASLPKTFTNTLINGNQEYFKSFYVIVYSQLFHVELSETKIPDVVEELKNESKQNLENHETIIYKSDNQGLDTNNVATNHQEINPQDDFKLFLSIFSILPGIKKSKAYKSLVSNNLLNNYEKYDHIAMKDTIYSLVDKELNKNVRFKIEKAIELVELRNNPESYLRVLSEVVKPSDPLYQKLKLCLNQSLVHNDQSCQREKLPTKSDMKKSSYRPLNKTSNLFVDDTNADNFILVCKYLPDNLKAILREKIHEFQKDYAPGGYYFSKQENPRDNSNTIKHFINKCTYQKGKLKPWINPTEENLIILEKLKIDLLSRYTSK